MFFNKSKFNIPTSRRTIIKLSILFAVILVGIQLFSGQRFSKQEKALYESLATELVEQKICTDIITCASTIHLERKLGSRIYFNLYDQKERTLAATIGKFLVKDGLKASQNTPITLKVYASPKPSFFSHDEPLLKLDIEKK